MNVRVMLCRLVLKKDDLDDAFKDKRFPESAKVEMLFERDQEKGAFIAMHNVHVYTCICLMYNVHAYVYSGSHLMSYRLNEEAEYKRACPGKISACDTFKRTKHGAHA